MAASTEGMGVRRDDPAKGIEKHLTTEPLRKPDLYIIVNGCNGRGESSTFGGDVRASGGTTLPRA